MLGGLEMTATASELKRRQPESQGGAAKPGLSGAGDRHCDTERLVRMQAPAGRGEVGERRPPGSPLRASRNLLCLNHLESRERGRGEEGVERAEPGGARAWKERVSRRWAVMPASWAGTLSRQVVMEEGEEERGRGARQALQVREVAAAVAAFKRGEGERAGLIGDAGQAFKKL